MHLSRTCLDNICQLAVGISGTGWEQQAPIWSYFEDGRTDQISAERSESDFLTPSALQCNQPIHHYCGSGSYLPPQISRCLVDKAITIIALSANTITLGMSTPQHNWGPSSLSLSLSLWCCCCYSPADIMCSALFVSAPGKVRRKKC